MFFKFFKRLRHWKWQIIAVVTLEIVLTLTEILVPLLSKIIFDYAYPFGDLKLLNLMIILSGVLIFADFWFDCLADYIETFVSQDYILKTKKSIYDKIQRLPYGILSKKGKGDLVIRLTEDIEQVEDLVFHLPKAVFINIFKFIAICIVSFALYPKVTYLVLASIPFYIWEASFFSKRMVEVEEENIEADSNVYDFIQERLHKIDLVKSYGREEKELKIYGSKILTQFQLHIKEKILQTVSIFSNNLTVQLWTVFITWYLGYNVIQGNLTIGEVVAISLLLTQIAAPIEELSESYSHYKIGLVSLKRLNEIEQMPNEFETDSFSNQKPLDISKGNIEFRDINFNFNPEIPLFENFSLKIPSKKTLALVGESGSGKSTLLSLLLGYYWPNKGQIFIDGQDISKSDLSSLRQSIGLVSQEYSVLSGTIRDNITYGKMDATEEEIERACEMAVLGDFIDELPEGLDTVITSGNDLSGGQKQRLALARALIVDPPILVFDEATAALDPLTEYHIQSVIEELSKEKTIIVVAHRLSTIKNAHTICVLKEGKIVEKGGFETLLNKKKNFFKLYTKQFGGLSQFKIQLEIELERMGRYNSKFSIAAFSALDYQEILEEVGELDASFFLDELEVAIKRELRLGDQIAQFGDGILFALFPEAGKRNCQGVAKRLEKKLPSFRYKNEEEVIKTKMSGVFLQIKDMETSNQVIENLLELLESTSTDGKYKA